MVNPDCRRSSTGSVGFGYGVLKPSAAPAGDEMGADLAEAFRQGASGVAQDLIIERSDWPCEFKDIDEAPVVVFHGEQDAIVDPGIAAYVCRRLPSCAEPIMFPGEGHSLLWYRYEEIIGAMFEA